MRALAGRSLAGDTTDRELLERYARRRDEQAFATLVERHGPVVRGVCRRVLGDGPDAEDAFQATFVVLARKAGSAGWRESVGPWLHAVASRVARKARAEAARRRAGPTAAAAVPRDPSAEVTWRELRTVLDEELDRLPDKYRAPLVLCYLESKTRDEAAAELGWTASVLKGRLERGRDRLRSRLIRRGVALSVALFGTALSETTASAQVPAALLTATVQTVSVLARASQAATTVSPQVVRLADHACRVLALAKLKLAGLVLLAVALIAAGAGVLSGSRPAVEPPGERAPVARQPEVENRSARADLYGDPLPPGAIARLGTARFRQGAPVACLAFAPDGKTLATGGNYLEGSDRAVWLWDVPSGKEVRRFLGHEHSVTAVAFSPDGKTLASGSRDETIRLWDVASGRQRVQLPGDRQVVWYVLFSPDGKTLVSVAGAIVLWDVSTRKERQRLRGDPSGQMQCVAFSPDGKLLASGAQDRLIRLWDVATGTEVRQIEARQGWVRSVAFSPDGKHLASGGQDKTPRLWEVASGKELHDFEREPGLGTEIAFSPDGKLLLAVCGNRALRLWDVATGKRLPRFDAQGDHQVNNAAFSPDGKLLAAGGYDNGIRLWEVETGKELTRAGGHRGPASAVAFLADGKTIVSGSWDGTVQLWEADTGKPLGQLDGAATGTNWFALSPDRRLLAVSSYEQLGNVPALCLWDMATRRHLRRLTGHAGGAFHVAFFPDARTLATAGAGGTIRLWDFATGKELRQLTRQDGEVYALAVSPDGRRLASGGKDGSVHFWDVATGKELRRFGDHVASAPGQSAERVLALAFSPDGKTLVSGSGPFGDDRRPMAIRLWEVATGKERCRLAGHEGSILTLAYSPDGRVLASGGLDHTIRLWDPLTGRERLRLLGHHGAVKSIAFSPDARRLASASSDTTLLVWDIADVERQSEVARRLSAADLERHWRTLADADARRAHEAIAALAAAPAQTVPFLKDRLGSAGKVDRQRVASLIADLDSDRFAVRERASRELEQAGPAAEAGLRRALAAEPSPEARRRLEGLLQKLEGGERWRPLRAIEVLEAIGTADARQVLESLAQGSPDATLTGEARAALRRLRD
jgi:RNA polymerase sigma factor (sigma-70 family)